MPYALSYPKAGTQDIAATDTVQKHPIGTKVTAVDPVYGEGEFIYMKGVANTVVGSMVVYDQYAKTTALTLPGVGRGPCAVSMSSNIDNQYGWYQISGAAVVRSVAATGTGAVYITATAGVVDDTAVAGDRIDGARYKTADGVPGAGLAVIQIDRPASNGS